MDQIIGSRLEFFLTLGLAICGLAALTMVLMWFSSRGHTARSGFEVKLNAGETPVTEKKDENHG